MTHSLIALINYSSKGAPIATVLLVGSKLLGPFLAGNNGNVAKEVVKTLMGWLQMRQEDFRNNILGRYDSNCNDKTG